jgi:uncharacterized protein (TIGR03435 family)
MKRLGGVFGSRRKLLLSAAGFVAAVLAVFGSLNATQNITQSQPQRTSANAPALEYEVVSIKLFKRGQGATPSGAPGISETPDGLVGRTVTVKRSIQKAYAVEDYQISGVADWISSELYDVEAKFGSATVDELQKLSPNDRILARQAMLQALLADRFNLTIHRENKDVQGYMLIVAKNGPKLQHAKQGDTDSNQPKDNASMAIGTAQAQMGGQGTSLLTLARMLTTYVHRPVLDNTGLTDKYDFTLRWTPDQIQPQRAPGIQDTAGGALNSVPVADPNGGPSLFTAIQEQLGLKLESGKGPVEFVVIDHVERPSGN